MALPHISVEDCFPIVRQTILDTYKIDSFLMNYPYSDLERLDMGLRKMVWGTYSTNSAIFSLSPEQDAWQIIILKSVLGFYNLIITVTNEEHPTMFGFMPFRTEPATLPVISRIMRENGIPLQYTADMQQFYYTLPVVEMQSLITTLQHLITAFIPEFANSHIEHVNYTSEQHKIDFNEERLHKFASDYLAAITEHLTLCGDAVASGNQALASERLKVLLDSALSFTDTPLSPLRERLAYLNAFLSTKLLDTQVHPSYIFNQLYTFQLRIYETTQMSELQHLPYEMVRKYCQLVKNFTYDNYSYLIRSVVNYINQHLSSELSLATLASEFGKNASYLSSEFKKEVGDTLTTYINKHRILASLRYFNTTDMSVAEVSVAVGYTDMGYFSRLFRKYVGQSPREYKKMLDK